MHNNKSRIILSFDDGRYDNYRVAKEILLPRKLSATFNITTGYIEKNIKKSNMPCKNPALSIDNVIELGNYSQFEIAGHGHKHLNTIEDWKKGIGELKNWLGDNWLDNGVGIASPHSKISRQQIKENMEELKQLNIIYVRVALKNQFHFTQRCISKLGRISHSKYLFNLPIQSSINRIGNDICIYSVPILHEHTVEQIKYTIERAIKSNKDCVFMLHSILKPEEPFYDSMWAWDYMKFVELSNILEELRDQGMIDVVRSIDAFERKRIKFKCS